MRNGPTDTRYIVTDKGWMDSVCFSDWFQKLFIPSISQERPVILIFDGHKSHISVPLIQSAVENQVILLKLPPNSIHTLQPLDVGVYGPLKTAWSVSMDPSRQPGRCLWTPQDSLVGVYGPLKTAWSVSMDPSRQPGRCLWTPQDSLVGVYGPLKTAWSVSMDPSRQPGRKSGFPLPGRTLEQHWPRKHSLDYWTSCGCLVVWLLKTSKQALQGVGSCLSTRRQSQEPNMSHQKYLTSWLLSKALLPLQEHLPRLLLIISYRHSSWKWQDLT